MFELACGDFESLIRSENFIAITAITLGCGVGVVGIIGGTVSGIMKTKAQEQTKREIAAYVAEGTIDPQNAVAMLNAGRGNKCQDFQG